MPLHDSSKITSEVNVNHADTSDLDINSDHITSENIIENSDLQPTSCGSSR